jgi:hypothetical protein
MQPYAADKVQRFQELSNFLAQSATQNVGPGAYNLTKQPPPPVNLPISTAVAKANGLDFEPPMKHLKMKLKETAN